MSPASSPSLASACWTPMRSARDSAVSASIPSDESCCTARPRSRRRSSTRKRTSRRRSTSCRSATTSRVRTRQLPASSPDSAASGAVAAATSSSDSRARSRRSRFARAGALLAPFPGSTASIARRTESVSCCISRRCVLRAAASAGVAPPRALMAATSTLYDACHASHPARSVSSTSRGPFKRYCHYFIAFISLFLIASYRRLCPKDIFLLSSNNYMNFSLLSALINKVG